MFENRIDYFLELEVHMLASEDVIKAAYKKLSQKYHPDNGGDVAKLLRIQEAYAVLSDAIQRREYTEYWIKLQVKNSQTEEDIKYTLEELIFYPLQRMVAEYMYFIMTHEYDQAYEMLSLHNRRRVFKKDFILWQKLISEVHELKEYECILASVSLEADEDYDTVDSPKYVVFKVKVKELNHLLNRHEEDFFLRYVCYEHGQWRIRLKDNNIQSVIKKYKKIISINKRNTKNFKKLLPAVEDRFSTRDVSPQTFIQNCEYEYLRFLRYQRSFTMIKMAMDTPVNHTIVSKLLQAYSRSTDTFCEYEGNIYLIMLTETSLEEGMQFCKKIKHVFANEKNSTHVRLNCRVLQVKEYTYGIKEMLDTIMSSKPSAG